MFGVIKCSQSDSWIHFIAKLEAASEAYLEPSQASAMEFFVGKRLHRRCSIGF